MIIVRNAPPAPKRPLAFFDLETYRDYFLCKFLFDETDEFLDIVMVPGQPFNILRCLQVLATHTIVGFNSLGYDCPILALALSGADNQRLKDANDHIIMRGLKYWEFYDTYNVGFPVKIDHIDIMEVLPGVRIGLKKYGGISHAQTIQDLPIDPSSGISPIQRMSLSKYCGNDLLTTRHLYRLAVEKEWIPLREHITADIGIDVRSKSDAQIAEAITKARLGFTPNKRWVESGYQFTYRMPDCVEFKTPQLQEVKRIVETSPFTVLDKDMETDELDDDGKKLKSGIKMHADIKKIRVSMGVSVYKFGAGGLHSQEHGVIYETTDDEELVDIDVGSFYPKIIITQGLYPIQAGPKELEIYTGTYNERMSAKRAGRKKEANSKKIVLNGKFGKLGSKYSNCFYAPELLMQVTISGQLYLLMLIEEFELNGISVVSANTDGIVTKTPRHLIATRDTIIKAWEARTGMEMEYTYYRGIYMRDVNNYFAITMPDKNGTVEVKRKGIFTKPEVGSGPSASKAPHREICYDAVMSFVKDGTPLEHTVYRCRDIRKFLTVRDVKGGCVRYLHTGTDREAFDLTDPGQYEELGKVVRWAYRRDYEGALNYKTNGNMVADSTGAWPLMTLPDRMPDWIDYEYYIDHARKIAQDIGIRV